MKIVYFISSLSRSGGTERVVTTKVNWLSQQPGFEISLIVMQGNTSYFPISENIKIYYTDSENIHSFKEKSSKILYDINPDIAISTFGPEASFLYKIKDGSKKIIEFHYTKNYIIHLVNGIPNLKFKFLHILKAKINKIRDYYLTTKYNAVVLLTDQDKALWGNKKKMMTIPNPLSFVSEKKTDLSTKKIIAVGRIFPQKGYDLLIKSFKYISDKFPEWSIDIYGGGEEIFKNQLEDLILKEGMNNRISIKSPVKNINEIMLDYSIFVFPSRYEGFGLVLTEAMECGLPCVAFDCECGPREILEDGKSGFLVPVGDVKSFADKLSLLIENEDMRIRMGKNAVNSVKRFYPDNIMPKWMDLFNLLKN